MRPADRINRRTVSDLDRAARDVPTPPTVPYTLMRVESASAISGTEKRWLYTVTEYTVGSTSSYTPAPSVNAVTFNAISISELSNGTSSTVGSYAYGVTKSNVPGGFEAVQIPIGTCVMCVPYWRSNGSGIYVIINTQAIDGQCTPFTGGGDIDGGTYTGEAPT